MSLEREPFSAHAEISKQTEHDRRKRAAIYRTVFSTPAGKFVLADLKNAFGFNRPSAAYGMSHGDICLRDGMKQPLFYIDRLLEASKAPKPKRQKKAQPKLESPNET